jgi:hypothetical protein
LLYRYKSTNTDATGAAGEYDADPRVRLGVVERDLNMLVYNALTYNECKHPVNIAARRLYKAARGIFQMWWKRGELPCLECGEQELFVENPILICDWCCIGVHLNCQRYSIYLLY